MRQANVGTFRLKPLPPGIEPKAPGERLPVRAGWRFGEVSPTSGGGVTWLA